jgi:hypothetical protein
MDDDEKRTDDRQAGKPPPRSERETRLAAALRANLRRRKASAPKPTDCER